MILEGYKDEIAQSKHKPARRVIINNKWLPYGERPSDDKERAEYGTNLLQLVKSAIDTSGGDSGVRKVWCDSLSAAREHLLQLFMTCVNENLPSSVGLSTDAHSSKPASCLQLRAWHFKNVVTRASSAVNDRQRLSFRCSPTCGSFKPGLQLQSCTIRGRRGA